MWNPQFPRQLQDEMQESNSSLPDSFVKQLDSRSYAFPAIPSKPQEKTIKESLHEPGVKDDKGKLRWDLMPWKAVKGLVAVLTFGARKYTPNGWRVVPDAESRYTAALLRHLAARAAGERLDPESGLRHIDHILCNAAFLSELED